MFCFDFSTSFHITLLGGNKKSCIYHRRDLIPSQCSMISLVRSSRSGFFDSRDCGLGWIWILCWQSSMKRLSNNIPVPQETPTFDLLYSSPTEQHTSNPLLIRAPSSSNVLDACCAFHRVLLALKKPWPPVRWGSRRRCGVVVKCRTRSPGWRGVRSTAHRERQWGVALDNKAIVEFAPSAILCGRQSLG